MSIKVQSLVWERAEPKVPAQRLVLLSLADHASDHDATCWPSVRRIAARTSLSERAVQYSLRALERDGFIRTVRGGRCGSNGQRRASTYTVVVAELGAKGAPGRAQTLQLESAIPAPSRAQGLRPEGAIPAPQSSENHHIDPPSIRPDEPSAWEEIDRDQEPVLVTAEEIYQAYPKKIARATALSSIAKAIKGGVDPVFLHDRVKAFAAAVSRWPAADRARYTPHCSTWINRESFHDDPAAWERGDGKNSSGNGSELKTEDGYIYFTDRHTVPSCVDVLPPGVDPFA